MTQYLITSGVTSTGLVAGNGDVISTFTGGTDINAIVNSGGSDDVAGGTDTGAKINAGGKLNVASGTASNAVVNGGTVLISGGTAVGLTISNGGTSGVVVEAGGVLSGGTIGFGTNAIISSGGTANGVTANSAGLEISGGVASSAIILAFGHLDVYNGGSTVSATVSASGIENIYSGAIASGTTVTGGTVLVSGGTAVGLTISNGGANGVVVEANGLLSSSTIFEGTNAVIDSGGTARGVTANNAGLEVNSSGTASASIILSGGHLDVASSGSIVSAIINSGGTATLSSGGSATSVTVSSGGVFTVSSGGSANVTSVNAGEFIVYGTANGATIIGNDDGQADMVIEGGGTGFGIVLNNGALVNAGGADNGTTISGVFAEELVEDGGSSVGTMVRAGGDLVVLKANGDTSTVSATTTGATLSGNSTGSASESVQSGGEVISTTVGSAGVLVIRAGGIATGTTLLAGGKIDVVSGVLTFTGSGTANWDSSTGILTVTEGGTTYTQQLTGNYAEDQFKLSSDTNGGTDITLCFYSGTHIATPAGEVAVENLAAGDLVLTSGGAAQPVVWLGRSTVSTRFADPETSSPIRIKTGALGEGLPVRDLLVSPNHALFLDGILVQANALVNGMSIVRETNLPERFTYFHVELATHELLISEGVPSESFVDNVDRMSFDNWEEHEALFRNKVGIEEMPYPRAKAARQIPATLSKMLVERATQISAIALSA